MGNAIFKVDGVNEVRVRNTRHLLDSNLIPDRAMFHVDTIDSYAGLPTFTTFSNSYNFVKSIFEHNSEFWFTTMDDTLPNLHKMDMSGNITAIADNNYYIAIKKTFLLDDRIFAWGDYAGGSTAYLIEYDGDDGWILRASEYGTQLDVVLFNGSFYAVGFHETFPNSIKVIQKWNDADAWVVLLDTGNIVMGKAVSHNGYIYIMSVLHILYRFDGISTLTEIADFTPGFSYFYSFEGVLYITFGLDVYRYDEDDSFIFVTSIDLNPALNYSINYTYEYKGDLFISFSGPNVGGPEEDIGTLLKWNRSGYFEKIAQQQLAYGGYYYSPIATIGEYSGDLYTGTVGQINKLSIVNAFVEKRVNL